MKIRSYNVLSEPKGNLYRDILDYALPHCEFALLVVRPSQKLLSKGLDVLALLEPFQIEKRTSREWPGTILYDETALVYRFKYNAASAVVFQDACQGLYDWVQPNLPEDLGLLRPNDEVWLGSIAHERDAFFCQSEEEMRNLLDSVPMITSSIGPPDGR